MELRCDDVHKGFDGTPVVRGISFALARGRCLALLGPSGCGKSTLLHLVAGLLHPDQGSIKCGGLVLDDAATGVHLPPERRRFAMVFQDFSLWPHMTVRENVEFGPRRLGWARERRKAAATVALDRVRMLEFADRRPGSLSGGQQQRVAIARAVASEPRVLLFDEPLSALDARLREDLRGELAALIRSLAATTLFVTHDQLEALTLADEVAVLRDGRIEQQADPETLYRSPRTSYVASFVGGANLLRGSIDGGVLRLPTGEELAIAAGDRRDACVMVRREHVQVQRQESANAAEACRFDATCSHSSFHGDRYEVFAETKGGLVIRAYSEHAVDAGRSVAITFQRSALRVLDE